MQLLYLCKNRLNQLTSNPAEIPKEISNLIELEALNLEINRLSGPLPMEIFNIPGMRKISLSYNNLSGSLPPNMCSILPNIEKLYLNSLTNLVGTIPHSISNCSKLTHLELSYNQFTSLIPNSLGYLTHLHSLSILQPSKWHASILHGEPFHLSKKILGYNSKIKGRIPKEVGNLSSLLDLVLSGNNLVGSIPKSIGNLRNLQRINLSDNKLTGLIGDHICKLQHLGDIYLGQNQLLGSLPNCLGNITSLREIRLGSNKLSSNIPPILGNLQDLVATLIDLSVNQFSKEIPREIGGLQTLAYLSLRHNKLEGAIPDSMSNMVGLEFLDLSHNNISGIIPKSLEKLQNLKSFNVYFNKLNGEIPSGGPFKNFPSQFFIYNEALCGSSRFSVPPCPPPSKHRSNRKKLLVLFLLLGIALVFVPSIFMFLWIRYRRGKRAPQQPDSLASITRERISYYELLQATEALSESNLIGSGSFGSVYKGVLRSGTAIAVKVFNLQLDAAFKSFDTECEVLRSFRHRNLVKVITSCSNLDFQALVLEYMPNGNLEKYLYSHNYFLDIM
ncbi:hypothetical protein P3S68_002881 [Capsicum galapagoense]